MRRINSRIEGVKKTKQITNSMKLVASSKVHRSRSHMENNTAFYNSSVEMMDFLSKNYSVIKNPYFERGESALSFGNKKATIIVVSTDRGLCGGFNASISKEAVKLLDSLIKDEIKIIALGSKVESPILRAGYEIDYKYLGLSETPLYEEAKMIGSQVIEFFEEGFQNVYMVYTEFINILQQTPVVKRILPFKPKDANGDEKFYDVESSPTLPELLKEIAPQFVTAAIYDGMVRSAASEQAARMTNMDSASRNSDEIIEKLTLDYNQLRQGRITQEITEIASGAMVVTEGRD